MSKITFRTLVKNDVLKFKRWVSKTDTDMQPCDHSLYNADFFETLLNKAYQSVIKEYTCGLDSLPENVTVDNSNYFAVVTIQLPTEFC